MIPCPECHHLCGIRDALLVGDDLFYRCSECQVAFDVERQLIRERLASEDDIFEVEDDTTAIEASEAAWDETTPLVPPPHLTGAVPEELVTGAPRKKPTWFEDTPSLGSLLAAAASRMPEVTPIEVVRPLRALLAPPPLPNETRITRRLGRDPSALPPLPVAPETTPPPRLLTPLTFVAAPQLDSTHVSRTDDAPPFFTGAARRIVQAIVAGSAMVGVALVLAVAARSNAIGSEPAPVALRLAAAHNEPAPPALVELPPAPTVETPRPGALPVVAAPIEAAPVTLAMLPTPRATSARRERPALTEAEVLAGEGDRAYRSGRFDRAASFYERALALSPSFFPARLGAAAADWETGHRDRARTRYRSLLEEAPDRVPADLRDRARDPDVF